MGITEVASRTQKRLPDTVRGLLPLLIAAKLLGLAPYSLCSQRKVVRCWIGMTSSAVVIAAQASLAIIWHLGDSNAAPPTVANSSIEFLMMTTNMAVGIALPLLIMMSAGTCTNVKRCSALLDQFRAVEQVLGMKVPTVAKCRWVVAMLLIFSSILAIEILASYLFWSPSTVCSVYSISSLMAVCIICHLFCTLATVIKKYFEYINKKVAELVKMMKKDSGLDLEAGIMAADRNDFHGMMVYVMPKQPIKYEDERLPRIERSISELREAHFLVQDASAALDALSGNSLLLLYAYVIIALLCSLYFIALGAGRLSIAQTAYLALTAGSNAALGAWAAWAAGGAAAAGGSKGMAAAAALLVAARGNRAAEKEAKIFLLQLQAGKMGFRAGGLFPVDLRFFVGLLGTILGYLAVVVQFAQTSNGSRTSN